MATTRAQHTATLFNSGKVIVAGGRVTGYDLVGSSEIYDPLTSQWSPTASMITPRYLYAATLLNTGDVLAAGGQTASGVTANCEIYYP
ncbi:unnamed protein product [Didymodactylos carnosus]|nr:unnamed protein product [Didymodactylos carnosus]CAF3712622.1 unnamed protein product [Didymodactylos carnosus]